MINVVFGILLDRKTIYFLFIGFYNISQYKNIDVIITGLEAGLSYVIGGGWRVSSEQSGEESWLQSIPRLGRA